MDGPDVGELLPLLMGMLGGKGSEPAPEGQPEGEDPGGFDFSAAAGLLELFQSMDREGDEVRLLKALKPLLSESRQGRVEQAVKLMRLAQVLPLLSESGLLSRLF